MSDTIDRATATMIRNIEEKSGKSMAEWQRLVQGLGPKKHGELVAILKERHGLGHGQANLVVHHARGALAPSASGGADLVEAMFAGDKAALRPIYEAIVTVVQGFGSDVEVSPKKTYVSLRRSKQFALVQPTTKTRVDVGINLKGVAASGRLEASGSFNAMVSHRVRVASPADVDRALVAWLKQAYDRA